MAGSALAQDGRLDILTQSGFLARMNERGDWAAERNGRRVAYTCQTCAGEVVAMLDVWALKDGYSSDEARKAYLVERRDQCADWAVAGTGRCLATDTIRLRGDALRGYRSSQVVDGVTSIETILFYRDPQWGAEVIRSVVSATDASDIPDGTVEMLRTHMLRLTLFW